VALLSQPAPSGETVLEARGITKLYGGLRAVDGVSFSVRQGEILGIAGPNGAGKTTLFDTITGHTVVSSGEIVLSGAPVTDARIHSRCRLGLARTFQHPVAAETLTTLENAYLAASFRHSARRRGTRAADIAAAEAALETVGLADQAATPSSLLTVSGKKRLMIATALATDPRVLLLDEPFGGLNPNEVDDTVALIRRIRDGGMAIVCIEHVMRALVALADRVLVMHHGAELFIGTPQAMMADPNVIEVYLGSRGGPA
jgi:branched-chain amino acid transport system ATP-binding protein